jgi:hypothetical protein
MDARDDAGPLSTPQRASRHILDAGLKEDVDEVWKCLAQDVRSGLTKMNGSEEAAKGWLRHDLQNASQNASGWDHYELGGVNQDGDRAKVEVVATPPPPFDVNPPHRFVLTLIREGGEWKRTM